VATPPHDDEDRELGFLGMLNAGADPQQAWESIRADLAADPGSRAIFADLAATPQGQESLEWSRRMWARHGLPAPFDDLPDAPGGE
jgi:hypothetical protein